MKRQQKLSLFFTPKRVATESEDQGELEETNDEGGEISTTASQPAEVAEHPVEPTASTSTTVKFISIGNQMISSAIWNK